MSAIESKRRGYCHGLKLHFSEDDAATLLRSTLSARELYDEKGQLITTTRMARCGHDYRWSRGVRAFSILILEQLLWHRSPETNLQAEHRWRLTLYNILRQESVMSSTRWVAAICGYQGDGRSYLGRLFENRGQAKNPCPTWNDKTIKFASVQVFRSDREITHSFDELASLFKILTQGRADNEAKHEAILCSSNRL